MGGMPLLDSSQWLHEVNALYLTLIPCYIWLNNFAGPKAMEPVFCKDYLIAQFDKISGGTSSTSANTPKFTPSAGKAPQLPKNLFARFGGNPRARAVSFGFAGLLALAQPNAVASKE